MHGGLLILFNKARTVDSLVLYGLPLEWKGYETNGMVRIGGCRNGNVANAGELKAGQLENTGKVGHDGKAGKI